MLPNDPPMDIDFAGRDGPESGRRDGSTQVFQINDYFGAMVDGVAGAGLATP